VPNEGLSPVALVRKPPAHEDVSAQFPREMLNAARRAHADECSFGTRCALSQQAYRPRVQSTILDLLPEPEPSIETYMPPPLPGLDIAPAS